MLRKQDSPSSHNGSKCRSYCWSQNHSDIEISVKLTKIVKYENVNVVITSTNIKVELVDTDPESSDRREPSTDDFKSNRRVLLEGQFEHSISTESVYWLLDSAGPCIMIYMDKSENIWWKQLLLNEQVTESSPRNYSILMDHLDNGSRMVVDRLVVEQRNKRIKGEDFLSNI